MALTYKNPEYMTTGQTFHVRIECSNSELPDILNTANSLNSFAQVEHTAKYNVMPSTGETVVYRVEIMFGESRDCEWFLLKFPTAKHLEYQYNGI